MNRTKHAGGTSLQGFEDGSKVEFLGFMIEPAPAACLPPPRKALAAIDLSKRIKGDALVLDTVSLAVQAGEIYSILGAAGAGKSMLLHTFLGLSAPTSGRVFVEGVEVTDRSLSTRRRITYVPKGAPLYGALSAVDNVRFFTGLDGTPRLLAEADYLNAMRRMGVAERYFDTPARKLGSAVSLALWLAIGFLKDTPILLIDEPTAGLDLHASADLQESLREFSQRGKAVLIATSDVLLTGAVADRVGILKDGRKRIELTRAELAGRSLPQLYLEYMGRVFGPPASGRS